MLPLLLLRGGPALCLLALGAGQAVGQQPPRDTTAQRYRQVAPGVLASSSPLFTSDSVPRYRVEVRDFVIGPNKTTPQLPGEGYMLLELRSGVIETTLDGKAVRRETGSIWLVPPGRRLGIRNIGEAAILRAVVLVPR